VPDDVGSRISARAASHVGAPFRLHGRSAVGGFDCIGLAADALSYVGFDVAIAPDYSLRGQFEERFFGIFDGPYFTPVAKFAAGDFLLVRTAPRQLHLMIATTDGFVHAHAGLRRVVLTPAPSPWPIIGQWRCVF
jgi:cell wall-associated NlpC family hydrolase